MNLNWIDVTVLILLSVTTVKGLLRGFIRSVFDILALAVAIFCAFYWYKDFSVFILGYIKIPENLVYVAGFVSVWVLAYIVTTMTGTLIHKLVGSGIFGPLNHIGGGLIGAAKGLLLIWLVLQFIFMLPLPAGFMMSFRGAETIKILDPVLKQFQSAYETMGPKKIPDMNGMLSTKYKVQSTKEKKNFPEPEKKKK